MSQSLWSDEISRAAAEFSEAPWRPSDALLRWQLLGSHVLLRVRHQHRSSWRAFQWHINAMREGSIRYGYAIPDSIRRMVEDHSIYPEVVQIYPTVRYYYWI